MSGPKIDRVALERAKAAELERQRQEKIKAISELGRERKEANQYLDSLNDLHKRYLSSVADAPELEIAVDDSKRTFSALNEAYMKVVNRAIPSETNEIIMLTKSISQECKAIVKSYEVAIKRFVDRIENYLKNKNREMILEPDENINVVTFASVYGKNISDNNSSGAEEKTRCEKKSRDKDVVFKEIQSMLNRSLPSDIRKKLMDCYYLIKNGNDETEHNILTYEALKVSIKREICEFSECVEKYNALMGYIKTENLFSAESIETFQSTEHLKNKILFLEEKIKRASEQSYAQKAVAEVLKDFGYDLCEEIVFFGNASGNHMISYAQNSDKGIHTYISEDEKIMMEFVGVEHNDHFTNGSSDSEIFASDALSETQKEFIYHNQILFCEQHKEICKKLKYEYGVILECWEHMAPDKNVGKVISSTKINNNKPTKKENRSNYIKERCFENDEVL